MAGTRSSARSAAAAWRPSTSRATTALGRPVALKVLAEHLAGDEVFRARFLREARLAARVVHPNVVQVYDAGGDESSLYIAMEYVDGESLARGARAPRAAVRPARWSTLGLQLAAALEAAHAAGLVHRDVKPANVLRAPRRDGEARRLRHRALARRDGAHRARLGARHGRLPLARAGARRAGHRRGRPLRARRRALRGAHRPPAARGREPRGARAAPRARAGRLRRARWSRACRRRSTSAILACLALAAGAAARVGGRARRRARGRPATRRPETARCSPHPRSRPAAARRVASLAALAAVVAGHRHRRHRDDRLGRRAARRRPATVQAKTPPATTPTQVVDAAPPPPRRRPAPACVASSAHAPKAAHKPKPKHAHKPKPREASTATARRASTRREVAATGGGRTRTASCRAGRPRRSAACRSARRSPRGAGTRRATVVALGNAVPLHEAAVEEDAHGLRLPSRAGRASNVPARQS